MTYRLNQIRCKFSEKINFLILDLGQPPLCKGLNSSRKQVSQKVLVWVRPPISFDKVHTRTFKFFAVWLPLQWHSKVKLLFSQAMVKRRNLEKKRQYTNNLDTPFSNLKKTLNVLDNYMLIFWDFSSIKKFNIIR